MLEPQLLSQCGSTSNCVGRPVIRYTHMLLRYQMTIRTYVYIYCSENKFMFTVVKNQCCLSLLPVVGSKTGKKGRGKT